MGTDPWERINHWKRTEGHIWGEVLESGLTYHQAQAREASEAAQRGCYCQPGGQYVPGQVWSVYHVSGGRIL